MVQEFIKKTQQTYCSPQGAQAFIEKEKVNHDYRQKTVYQIVDDINFTNLRVLDVGCAFGRDVFEFRRRGAEAYGCDISQELLDEIPEHPEWFKQSDLLDNTPIPFAETFDLVWACAVFVHIPRENLSQVLKKLWDKVADGGTLIIATKQGNGEKIATNLGEGLERLMVYYQKDEFLSILQPWGGVEDTKEQDNVTIATGDDFFFLRIKKLNQPNQ